MHEQGARSHPAVVWPIAQLIYSEGDTIRYETGTNDDAVVDARLDMNLGLGFFRQLGGFASMPMSTPISMSIIRTSAAFRSQLSIWAEKAVSTVTSIDARGSPFSSWYNLDAFRYGGHPSTATFTWSRFLARLSIFSVAETPTTDVARVPMLRETTESDVAQRDDIMAAMAAVQAVLDLTTEELSAATGVGLRTLRRWRSRAVRPRRRTARSIWRLYVAASALQKGLGIQGVAAWLHVGSPSPMEILAAGDLAAFEGLARSRILSSARVSRPYSGFAEDQPEDRSEPRVLRRAIRRPTRGRLRST